MKILYVTTIASTMSFFVEHFKMLVKDGHIVELASNLDQGLRENIQVFGFKKYNLAFSRSPMSLNNLKALNGLKTILRKGNYDIVHCHTPNAAAITRFACRKMRKNGLKVFYTAHGFHFYKGAPWKNWILHYPIEWICSFWTDTLITINKEDYQRAKRNFHAKKIVYLPGVGINFQRLDVTGINKERKRNELGLLDTDYVLLSVGDLNANKNHKVVINALELLRKEKKRENLKYLICGQGDQKEELEELIKAKELESIVILLGYRLDIPEICAISDVFVHPSYREGLSVALMEAMVMGLPCIASNIRGNTDLIDDGKGGILFDANDVIACSNAIRSMDVVNRKKLGEYNRKKIEAFSAETIVNNLRKQYLNC